MPDQGFSEELLLVESCVHHDLDVLLCKHECFLRDWYRVKWLHDGDRNSAFFHAYIPHRQYRKALFTLSINEVLSIDRLVIRDHIVSYYSALFSSDSSRVGYDFSMVNDTIPNMVMVTKNDFLIDIPSVEDIHDAIFAIDNVYFYM
ncbi:hypothetical protein Dsin_023003 [Dipteronia sinensis]|uniref:Uncharacterized protein n=1 Tax=Dipteronia sinensis TaxID=43782 RepID=A0AAE0A2F9_9ROSI|nr:hypothetical protein Dsin_023003 [Dipteronia sinensis]